MPLIPITPKVGKHFHALDGIRPQAEREYTAQAATALPFNSILAPDWGGFIKHPNGGLAINSDNSRARLRAQRLGFVIEEEGQRHLKVPSPKKAPRPNSRNGRADANDQSEALEAAA